MNKGPIGVFDSGLGGLSAVRRLRSMLPGEDLVYFGDTGRVPYGTRGRDTIIAYAKQDIAFLCSQQVKCILAACGTVSSTLPAEETDPLPVPYLGVVLPTAAAAAAAPKNGRVAVLGTEATVASGVYQAALTNLRPGVESLGIACPLFVPLVENGRFAPGDALSTLAAQEYLAPVQAFGADTVILGCTHYPLLAGIIGGVLGPDATLVDSGYEAAKQLQKTLEAKGLLSGKTAGGSVQYYVSDDADRFGRLAGIFLGGEAGGPVQQVNIEAF